MRQDHEQPAAIQKWGWRYHHTGIPTSEKRPGERYLEQYGMHVSGFEESPFGIEWMRFDDDSPIPSIIRTVPHVAFEVDDLDRELQGRELVWPPGSPSDGVRSATFIEGGALIELIWFARNRKRSPV
jgi:hypothetical protein